MTTSFLPHWFLLFVGYWWLWLIVGVAALTVLCLAREAEHAARRPGLCQKLAIFVLYYSKATRAMGIALKALAIAGIGLALISVLAPFVAVVRSGLGHTFSQIPL